ncbi:conserved hypothetical protein [Vibrio crassostreae]|uniref:Uncharacterized protein n=1 Tax=Vibrio crassostreae TaxID=246167 RepID=A0ABP1X584_9VIBR|nr:hypothetical protein EDB56_106188 [Vibrio crassostreae]ROO55059.1 hypothetical protein EDB58_107189 [Vibrio crassostreae]ROO69168.1 hypothetical protein EDB57_2835 [Vibrio crassostreae]ROO70708.1 hypothetical protein EDB53_2827 [Vibrio crassostreae]ROP21564.1 hypothetical protein EDB33_10560 [Vibrio crassostreae]
MVRGQVPPNDYQYLINEIDIYFSIENLDVFDYKNLIIFEVNFIILLCSWLFLF